MMESVFLLSRTFNLDDDPVTSRTSTLHSTDLVELVRTLPAEVVLTWQDDHRLVEDLHADGTRELLLQPCQCSLALLPPAAVEPGQVT